jgi:hypothetical protein
MNFYKILFLAFFLNSGLLFSQNKIDFSRPAEASLIEDKITEWIDLLFPETYYFFKKDSSSENYSNWNGLYIGETIDHCIPSGPDDEIYIHCDTVYYFRENNESYALLVFRHSENGQSGFQLSTWIKDDIHIVMSQQISLVLLKCLGKEWKVEEKIDNYKYLSSDDIIFTPVRTCEFRSPKIIIYGRNDILIEVNNKSGFGGQFSLTSRITNETLVYHLSYSEPILSTYSAEFHLTPLYSNKDSNNYAYSGLEPVYSFDGDKPLISLKLRTKKSNTKLDEQFLKDNFISETDLISLSEFEKGIDELEKSKSEIELKYLLSDLKKEMENSIYYYPKKYKTLTEKEAYELIAGKSLSYYYYSDDYFLFDENLDLYNQHKNIPYVNHIFLENGDYYKITNVLKPDVVQRSAGNYYCSSFYPAILKKGKWKIAENKILLELEDYNFDKFNSLVSNEEYGYNYENYNMHSGLDTKTSNDIKNLRTGWPFNNYIEIDKLSDLNTLLYEIAETECNYGYRIGNRFNLYDKNNISASIEITNKPLGNNGLSKELSDIIKLNEKRNDDNRDKEKNNSSKKTTKRKKYRTRIPEEKTEEAYDYEPEIQIIGDLELLKIRNEKFLKIYSSLKDYKKYDASEKFEMDDPPSDIEKKEETPKK